MPLVEHKSKQSWRAKIAGLRQAATEAGRPELLLANNEYSLGKAAVFLKSLIVVELALEMYNSGYDTHASGTMAMAVPAANCPSIDMAVPAAHCPNIDMAVPEAHCPSIDMAVPAALPRATPHMLLDTAAGYCELQFECQLALNVSIGNAKRMENCP